MAVRRQPYTEAGLRRLSCVRCGEPAAEQWNVRSCRAGLDWGYLPLCTVCDGHLNDIVLEFFDRMPART